MGFGIFGYIAAAAAVFLFLVAGALRIQVGILEHRITGLHAQVETLTTQKAKAEEAAKRNGDEVVRLSTDYAQFKSRAIGVERALEAAQRRIALGRKTIIEEIIHDPTAGDPLPPGMLRFAERLRELDRANPARRPR